MRDHQSLTHMREEQLLPVVRTLVEHHYEGVLTLEVFGEADFFSSREILQRTLARLI